MLNVNTLLTISLISIPILLLLLLVFSVIKEFIPRMKERTDDTPRTPKKLNLLKFQKKIVIFCISFIVIYTIVQLILSTCLGVELSPTLTTCVYAFFGTELAICALLRIFDKEDKKDNIDDIIGNEDNTNE